MTTSGESTLEPTSREPTGERIIGEYGDAAGPLLITIAGLHGNEPAGVNASRRVLERLCRERPAMRGRLVAFIGNLRALRQGRRFIDSDMNRMWSPGALDAVRNATADGLSAEQREQRDLLACVEPELGNGRRPVTIVDLHSTSADGAPFCIISDTLQNRRVAFPWAVPVILGLEEAIDGTIQEYFGARGHATAAVEGGQHGDPRTADHLESILWITLVSIGLLRRPDVGDLDAHRRRLERAAAGLPAVVEVFHRHGLSAGNGFEMHPGYRNFSPVRKGQRIARDQGGEVMAEAAGLLILPNYQGVGSDGFFLGRRVRRLWLRVSTLARKLHADRLLPLLPGVRRHPAEAGAVVVGSGDRFACRLLHLLGYQRWGGTGDERVFRRRREGPPAVTETGCAARPK